MKPIDALIKRLINLYRFQDVYGVKKPEASVWADLRQAQAENRELDEWIKKTYGTHNA